MSRSRGGCHDRDSLAQPPPTDAWVAAVHASEDDFEPLGRAVVIAADQVLTCAHVVMAEGAVRERLWVAFPNAAAACGVGSLAVESRMRGR